MREEKGNPEVKNPALRLQEKLKENKKSLHIARVPEKIKEAFISLAEAEFCGDYGMLLKSLMDGVISQDTQMILNTLEDHETRIQTLESENYQKGKEPEKKGRKMLDGSTKSIGGNENE